MQNACSNCGAPLTGEYCSACGQRRSHGRLTLGTLVSDVFRRVLHFDKGFAVTFWRMPREPGRLVPDYLAGRQAGILDPIHYLTASGFLPVAVASFTHFVAPVAGRTSALGWLGRLGGVMAIKVPIIFGKVPIWWCAIRVTAVLGAGYALLIGVIGPSYLAHILLPANGVSH
jgi:Protein of unknown function (DUF3667)